MLRCGRGVLLLLFVLAGVYAAFMFLRSEAAGPTLTSIAGLRAAVQPLPPPGYRSLTEQLGLPTLDAPTAPRSGSGSKPRVVKPPATPALRHIIVDTRSKPESTAEVMASIGMYDHDAAEGGTHARVVLDDLSTLSSIRATAAACAAEEVLLITTNDALVAATPYEIVHAFLALAGKTKAKTALFLSPRGPPQPAVSGTPSGAATTGSSAGRELPDGRGIIARAASVVAATKLAADRGALTYSAFLDVLRSLVGDSDGEAGVHAVVDSDAVVFLTVEEGNLFTLLEFDVTFSRWKVRQHASAYFCVALVRSGSPLAAELMRMLRGVACATCAMYHPWLLWTVVAVCAGVGVLVGARGLLTPMHVAMFLFALAEPLICLIRVPMARACKTDGSVEEVKAT